MDNVTFRFDNRFRRHTLVRAAIATTGAILEGTFAMPFQFTVSQP